jgi:hypothetical protein
VKLEVPILFHDVMTTEYNITEIRSFTIGYKQSYRIYSFFVHFLKNLPFHLMKNILAKDDFHSEIHVTRIMDVSHKFPVILEIIG